MKKILAMVSVAVILAALVSGCGKKEETPQSLMDKAKASADQAVDAAKATADKAAADGKAAANDAAKKAEEATK